VSLGTSFPRPFLARYRRAYNALMDVNDAHAELRHHRRHLAAIRAVLRVIRDHRANDFLGVTLLHRHFRALPNAVFVERRFTPRARRHKTVLVTCPIPTSKAPSRLAPHRFSFTRADELQPLEFTTDVAAIRAHARLAADERLQQDLARAFAGTGLGSLLGVGIFARARSVARATSVFLEETRFADRQSVVHVLPRLPHANRRLIPTLWTFGAQGDGVCETICLAYCSGHGGRGIGYCGHVKGQHVGRT
jgi:hypothetical protein